MNENPQIDFATTVYEKDWELILKTNRLRNVVRSTGWTFNKRTLYINNVRNYPEVTKYAQKHIDDGVIDEIVLVKDHEAAVKEFFKLKETTGYFYLIQLLTMIYRTESPFVLILTGDSIIVNESDWMEKAIRSMEKNPNVLACSPLKERHLMHVLRDTIFDDDDFYYSRVFTDQCFLADTQKFKVIDYNETNDVSMFYPEKSRGAFEERVFCYLYNHDMVIGKSKRGVYRNKNYPTSRFGKWLSLYLGYKRRKFYLGNGPAI